MKQRIIGLSLLGAVALLSVGQTAAAAFQIDTTASGTTLQKGDMFYFPAWDGNNAQFVLTRLDNPASPTHNVTTLFNSTIGPSYTGAPAGYYGNVSFDQQTGNLYFNIGYDAANTNSGYNSHSGFEVHELKVGQTTSTTIIPDLATLFGGANSNTYGAAAIAVAPGGNTIYVYNSGGTINKAVNVGGVWTSGGTSSQAVGYARQAATLRLTPDGKYLVASDGQGAGNVGVFDANTLARTALLTCSGATATNLPSSIAFGGIDPSTGNLRIYCNNGPFTGDTAGLSRITELQLNSSGQFVNPFAGANNLPGGSNTVAEVVATINGPRGGFTSDGSGGLLIVNNNGVYNFTAAQLQSHSATLDQTSATSVTGIPGGLWYPSKIDMASVPKPASLGMSLLGLGFAGGWTQDRFPRLIWYEG